MKSSVKNRISAFITLLVILLFAWYAWENSEIFDSLRQVSWMMLGLILFGRLVVFVSSALFTKWSIELFARKIGLGEGIYVAVLSSVANFFGPILGGAGLRGVYLKRNHGLSYSQFASTLMGYYIVLFTFNSIVSIIALTMVPASNQTYALMVFFFAWLVLMLALSAVRLPGRILKRHYENRIAGYVVKVIQDVEQGWRRILGDRRLMIRLILVALISYSGSVIMFAAEFTALGIQFSLPALLLYTSIVTATILVSFTPGALGIREALLLITQVTLGIGVMEIIEISLLDRVVNFGLLFVLLLVVRHSKAKKYLLSKEITDR